MNTIVVHDMKPVNGFGNLKAFARIQLPGGIQIVGCRVIQQPGQSAWLAMPQREWLDENGKKKYSPIVTLPPDLQQAAQESVLQAWEAATND